MGVTPMREWIVAVVIGGQDVGEVRVIASTKTDALLKAHEQLMTARVGWARPSPAPLQAA